MIHDLYRRQRADAAWTRKSDLRSTRGATPKYLTLACFVAALMGCALTPKEAQEQGTRRTFALQLPPERAAVCIERNAENISGRWLARHRALSDGALEVVIRYTEIFGVLAVAHVRAEGAGSAVEVWVSPYVLVDAAELTQSFIAGC